MTAENPMAFPVAATEYDTWGNHGMTLRDYFAGQAVGSVIHLCAKDTFRPGETIEQSFARKAYAIADAMLAARSAKNDT